MSRNLFSVVDAQNTIIGLYWQRFNDRSRKAYHIESEFGAPEGRIAQVSFDAPPANSNGTRFGAAGASGIGHRRVARQALTCTFGAGSPQSCAIQTGIGVGYVEFDGGASPPRVPPISGEIGFWRV